jgi:type II secretory pathway predicted ATPase ExeA
MHSLNDTSPRPLLDASASLPRFSASLTYEPFYGLREKPFSLSADPRFLFRSPAHGPAFDELLAGIRRREGLIVLTGEIGTGKTTLCRSVLQHLDRRTFASFVADPFVSREDLLKTLLVDFGVISIGDLTRGRFTGASRSDLSYPLYEFLDSLVPLQAFAVVVIDEAQNLSLPLLEEIRILSELERREKLLQVVLVGQPELRSNLKLPEMRQADQRVSVRCELTALDAQGVAGYVTHRLKVASSGESRVEFTAAALDAVYRGSSGVPRLINRICDRALQRGSVARSLQIDAPFVEIAIDDLGLSSAPPIAVPSTSEKPSAAGPKACATPARSTDLRPAVVEAAAAPRTPGPVAVGPDAEAMLPALAEFTAEADRSPAPAAPAGRSTRRQTWVAGALASCLVLSAGLGASTWYVRAQSVDDDVVAALLPPRPVRTFSRPGVTLPDAERVKQDALQAAVPAVASASAESVDYTIVVASFKSRTRAESLVEELTLAGYRAQAVERDWGPPRGRMLQVNVGGYASAIDVQRDLQQIRELPGGYGDAHIVERD